MWVKTTHKRTHTQSSKMCVFAVNICQCGLRLQMCRTAVATRKQFGCAVCSAVLVVWNSMHPHKPHNWLKREKSTQTPTWCFCVTPNLMHECTFLACNITSHYHTYLQRRVHFGTMWPIRGCSSAFNCMRKRVKVIAPNGCIQHVHVHINARVELRFYFSTNYT